MLPKLLRRISLVKIEDDRREKRARDRGILRFAVISFGSAATQQPIRIESYCQSHHQFDESGPFRPRIAFWRGTALWLRHDRDYSRVIRVEVAITTV